MDSTCKSFGQRNNSGFRTYEIVLCQRLESSFPCHSVLFLCQKCHDFLGALDDRTLKLPSFLLKSENREMPPSLEMCGSGQLGLVSRKVQPEMGVLNAKFSIDWFCDKRIQVHTQL